MKKKNITIFLLVLLCFGLISCDDEFGIKSIDLGMFVMVPEELEKLDLEIFIDDVKTEIYDKYPYKGNNNNTVKEIFVAENELFFSSNFIKKFEEKRNKIFYVTNSSYLETNENYKDTFLIKIKNDLNSTYSFTFSKDILSAMNRYEYKDLCFETEYGEIYCLFYYYYTVSI